MFDDLIHNYSEKSTPQQKQDLVKASLDKVKLFDLPTTQQQLFNNYDKLLNIFRNYPQMAVDLTFSKIIIEDCVRIMKAGDKELEFNKQNAIFRLLNDIGKSIDPQTHRAFIEWFSQMSTRYGGMEKVIIFMRELVLNYADKCNEDFLPSFISDFINSSRTVVEAYMKMRSQAPKYDFEFLEYGDFITKWTETWLKDFYVGFLGKIKVPKSKETRLAVLNGVCDIIGAIMEVQRESTIDFSLCEQILTQCFNYTKKLTTLGEFNDIYLEKLKSSGFNIPSQKIFIPARYPSNIVTFPKQSYCYIVFSFLKQSSLVYSHQAIINFLIPVINEMAPFEYKIKAQIENLFVQALTSNQVQIKTCYEGQFPLSIAYFNLWHFSEKKNKTILFALDKVFEKIKLENPKIFVNNWNVLSTLHIQDLDNEINQFIGEKALQVAGSHPELLVGLMRNVKFANTNGKGESLWKQVVSEMGKKLEVKQELGRILGQRGQRNKLETEFLKMVSEQKK